MPEINRPSKPPEFDEDLTSEEAKESIEQTEKELEELERQRLQERGRSTAAPRGIKENLESAWEGLLEPHFKGTELEEYSKHLKAALSNVVPIANIRRQDIPRFLSYFDEIWQFLKVQGVKLPPQTWASFRMVFELNLTRSVDMRERELQAGMPRREEQEEEKRGFLDLFR